MTSTGKSNMRLFNGHLKLDEQSLKKVFMLQLNNIFCVKKHMVDYLPALAEKASFTDLKNAILESIDDIKIQLLRMEKIYSILNEEYVENKCLGIKSIILEAYIMAEAGKLTKLESDMNMLTHLRIIENIEISSFTILTDIAAALPVDDLHLLLVQNLDMAKDCDQLYTLITKEYLN